jgi:hypothetical protein
MPSRRESAWEPSSAFEFWYLQYRYWLQEIRRHFDHTDNRSESELVREAQLIFDSRTAALEEIVFAHMFGSKQFLQLAGKEEKRDIDAALKPRANVVAERAYFIDCLQDDSAAYAGRWADLLRKSDPELGKRRAHFKDRRKPRQRGIEELAMAYLWAETIVLTNTQIPPLCFMTDGAAAKFLKLFLPSVAEHVPGLSRPTDRTLSLAAFRQRRKRIRLHSPRFSYVDGIEVEPAGFRLLFGLRKNARWKIATATSEWDMRIEKGEHEMRSHRPA